MTKFYITMKKDNGRYYAISKPFKTIKEAEDNKQLCIDERIKKNPMTIFRQFGIVEVN